ncbi:MAG: purine-nucleoside phosphorylase [Candidatus Hydrogenedentota bacterium]
MNSNFIWDAVNKIREKTKFKPEIALILGSGLGELADEIEKVAIIPYNKIPHFKVSTIKGHKSNLVLGLLSNKKVIAMQGRIHFYEGYSMFDVTFPLRVMNRLGAKVLIVTNAAGGINKKFAAGDLMIITDHINWSSTNPLLGIDFEWGERFIDMTFTYDKELQRIAKAAAKDTGIKIREGIYAFSLGPTYETPAEVRMLKRLGADSCGMSTVPEVIVARQLGMRILGISCISNMAAGILNQPLSHKEVIETTNKVKENFKRFIKTFLTNLQEF